MTTKRLLALSLSAAVAACVPPAPEPTPAPAPAPAPAPTPAPAPPPPALPAPNNWMDAPLTPGDWRYQAGAATFGEPDSQSGLILRCNRTAGTVSIERTGGAAATALTIRTETQDRSVAAMPAAGPPSALVAQLPARDALLDAMAFSKGRFAVEAAGLPPLYVPAYPEVTRVVEDCR
jgi:hypothetical protein